MGRGPAPDRGLHAVQPCGPGAARTRPVWAAGGPAHPGGRLPAGDPARPGGRDPVRAAGGPGPRRAGRRCGPGGGDPAPGGVGTVARRGAGRRHRPRLGSGRSGATARGPAHRPGGSRRGPAAARRPGRRGGRAGAVAGTRARAGTAGGAADARLVPVRPPGRRDPGLSAPPWTPRGRAGGRTGSPAAAPVHRDPAPRPRPRPARPGRVDRPVPGAAGAASARSRPLHRTHPGAGRAQPVAQRAGPDRGGVRAGRHGQDDIGGAVGAPGGRPVRRRAAVPRPARPRSGHRAPGDRGVDPPAGRARRTARADPRRSHRAGRLLPVGGAPAAPAGAAGQRRQRRTGPTAGAAVAGQPAGGDQPEPAGRAGGRPRRGYGGPAGPGARRGAHPAAPDPRLRAGLPASRKPPAGWPSSATGCRWRCGSPPPS